jgi:hypothetical protein
VQHEARTFPFVLIWVLPVYTSRPLPPLPHCGTHLSTSLSAHLYKRSTLMSHFYLTTSVLGALRRRTGHYWSMHAVVLDIWRISSRDLLHLGLRGRVGGSGAHQNVWCDRCRDYDHHRCPRSIGCAGSLALNSVKVSPHQSRDILEGLNSSNRRPRHGSGHARNFEEV